MIASETAPFAPIDAPSFHTSTIGSLISSSTRSACAVRCRKKFASRVKYETYRLTIAQRSPAETSPRSARSSCCVDTLPTDDYAQNGCSNVHFMIPESPPVNVVLVSPRTRGSPKLRCEMHACKADRIDNI